MESAPGVSPGFAVGADRFLRRVGPASPTAQLHVSADCNLSFAPRRAVAREAPPTERSGRRARGSARLSGCDELENASTICGSKSSLNSRTDLLNLPPDGLPTGRLLQGQLLLRVGALPAGARGESAPTLVTQHVRPREARAARGRKGRSCGQDRKSLLQVRPGPKALSGQREKRGSVRAWGPRHGAS